MKNISPKVLETNLESDLIPKTVEIVEITTDRFSLTESSFATLTESQIHWLSKIITISPQDYAKLATLRAEMAARISTIVSDVSSVDTLQLNSISDTNTVYTDWNHNDESMFDTEMPILEPGFDGHDFTSIFF